MNKKNLRKHYKKIRDNIPKEKLIRKSTAIISKLLKNSLYLKSKNVMIYISHSSEVTTHELCDIVIKEKGRVIVPKCCLKEKKIVPYAAKHINDLKIGAYNILEPDEDKCEKIENKNLIDVVVVPGISFDICGNRIGMGLGYYDRFLSDYTGFTVGFCYKETLASYIKKTKHDVLINKVFYD